MGRRRRLFVGLVAVCSVVGALSVLLAALGGEAAETSLAEVRSAAAALATRGDDPVIIIRSLDRSRPESYGKLAVTTPGSVERPRLGRLVCDRIHFAGGRGLCLQAGNGIPGGAVARIFGSDLEEQGEVRLAGVPSRTRVSNDGRYGATTTFVTGHSYADIGDFSTETLLIDLERGERIANLEEFDVTHAGKRLESPDRNFWGVTFAEDSNRFYATLRMGGSTYLIEGDLSARRARVLRENVECPSLSPDNRRVAYKKLVGSDPGVWRFHVLDLETMKDMPLAETRPIDDQIEWLDNETVLYRVDEAIFKSRADGTGTPQVFLAGADSPAVLRGS